MNENIDLTKILKNCPKGTKLYSLVHGEVAFECIETDFRHQYVIIELKDLLLERITFDGKICHLNSYDGECILFPSKDQRDWSKFTAPWYTKDRFDPKTLNPFDKVLVKLCDTWFCDFYSYYIEDVKLCVCVGLNSYSECIPYNEETKHLIGTNDEAPEFYRYWED